MKPIKRGKKIKSLIAGQRGTVIVYVGILILVFGDKEPPVKYWKGMESNMPKVGKDNFTGFNLSRDFRLSDNHRAWHR